MKTPEMKAPLLIFFFALIGIQVLAQSPVQALDKYFSRLEAKDKAMGSFAIFENGRPVYQKAIGHVSFGPEVKADTLTVYRIGSISKTFTATAILQMVEEGKLKLEDKLARFYPGWPHADKISIEDLLRHSSGIHNFGNDRSKKYRKLNPQTNAEVEAVFREAETDFRPGSRSEYNNANYVVLSLIAEKLDSTSFAEIIENRIAKPLRLTRTGYGQKADASKNEAYPFHRKGKKWIRMPEGDLTTLKGAGALVSTPTELCRFYTALFEEFFFPAPLLAEMKTMENGFGLGLFPLSIL